MKHHENGNLKIAPTQYRKWFSLGNNFCHYVTIFLNFTCPLRTRASGQMLAKVALVYRQPFLVLHCEMLTNRRVAQCLQHGIANRVNLHIGIVVRAARLHVGWEGERCKIPIKRTDYKTRGFSIDHLRKKTFTNGLTRCSSQLKG